MIVIKPNKLSLISIKRLIRWFEPFGFGLMKALVTLSSSMTWLGYFGHFKIRYQISRIIVTNGKHDLENKV